MHGLKTILRVSRLGIEGKENGLQEFLVYDMLFIFVGLSGRESLPIKTKNSGELQQQIRDNFEAVSLDFPRKCFDSLSSRLQKRVGPMFKSDSKW